MAPLITSSVPPLITVVDSAVPAERISTNVALPTIAPIAVPAGPTISSPSSLSAASITMPLPQTAIDRDGDIAFG